MYVYKFNLCSRELEFPNQSSCHLFYSEQRFKVRVAFLYCKPTAPHQPDCINQEACCMHNFTGSLASTEEVCGSMLGHREREGEIKFIGLFENRGHRGPYSPYKPFNHNLYIGIIIFPHIDNPQYTGYDLPKKKTNKIINEKKWGPH